VHAEAADQFCRQIAAGYQAKTGLAPREKILSIIKLDFFE